MTQETWTAIDEYFSQLLIPSDPALDETLQASEAAELPPINVAPNQGKMLMLLAMMNGAKNILEIGTLGGYSTIWMARALPPEGRVITLEYEPHHAEIARENIARAGFADQVDVRVGAALDTLPQLDGFAPFDFIFIDADKQNNTNYFNWALQFSRKGTVIIMDNVVRDGEVLNANTIDERVQGVRKFNEVLAAEPRVTATAIQTVGSKGYDGFALILVK